MKDLGRARNYEWNWGGFAKLAREHRASFSALREERKEKNPSCSRAV